MADLTPVPFPFDNLRAGSTREGARGSPLRVGEGPGERSSSPSHDTLYEMEGAYA